MSETFDYHIKKADSPWRGSLHDRDHILWCMRDGRHAKGLRGQAQELWHFACEIQKLEPELAHDHDFCLSMAENYRNYRHVGTPDEAEPLHEWWPKNRERFIDNWHRFVKKTLKEILNEWKQKSK